MFANQHTAALIAEMGKVPPAEHWLEELHDGTHVLVRPLAAENHARLLKFFRALSPLSLRFRFLGTVAHVDENIVNAFLNACDSDRVGYVALIHNDGELQVIGVSRYVRVEDVEGCACTVAVADMWQRKGLGCILLGHLIDAARQHGVRRMTSTDLSTDYAVHRLYKRFGFSSVYLGRDFDRIVHDLDL